MPYDTLEFVHVSFFTMTYVTFGYTHSSHLWFHLGFAHGFLSHSSVRTSGTLDHFLVISREREGYYILVGHTFRSVCTVKTYVPLYSHMVPGSFA